MFKNLFMFLLTIVIVVGIGTPHICLDDNIAQKTSVSDTAHSQHKHTKTSKAVDHCCVAHHCCAGKFMNVTNSVELNTTVTVFNFTFKNQTFSNFDASSFDRPPKSIA